jgi:predicted TIM-barrel fold metal-dependent hydrolase
MPLQDDMSIISVDDHLIEHPRVFQDRLADRFKAEGPRIVENEHGHHVWMFEGAAFPQIGLNAVAGKDPKDYGMEPVRYDDMIPGCYDPKQRVIDMDLDGVEAAMCFPSFPGFGGGVFQRAADKELAGACVEAWNDFSIDEWAASAPGRLIPLALVHTWDPILAAREVERVAAKGARSISFPDAPTSLGLPSYFTDHWEPLWDACDATQMPVSLHFGSGGFTPGFAFSAAAAAPKPAGMAEVVSDSQQAGIVVSADTPFAVATALFATNSMWTLVDLLFSGVLQRHPNLKFILSEGGIGWIPYILERTDYTWERHRWYQDLDRQTRPSDLWKDHFYGCFIEDVHGVRNRDQIGVDNLLIEIDYPHSDSQWPNSRKVIAENFHDVPDDEVRRMVELNARQLLRVPRTA